jgi:tRNA (cmo5U34)-methyltransferase
MSKLINKSWSFGGKVPKIFEKHIEKSVPSYIEGHNLILKLSEYFVENNSVIYDIGCSTGNLLKKLNQYVKKKNISFYGIEIEKKMFQYAKSNLKNSSIKLINKDISKIKLKKSNLILSYYTLQFIPTSVRQDVVNKIYNSLNWGSAFIVFEKIRGNDARFENIFNSLYSEFKYENKFSKKHIYDKAKSLRGVMGPFSDNGNLGLLKRAGFKDIQTIQQHLCFKGYLCIK